MREEAETNAVKCGGCKGDGNCNLCFGTGKRRSEPCVRCGGTGICPGCKGSDWIIVR